MWARGIIGRLRRPCGYAFRFPHASRDANFALRAICISARDGAIIASPFQGLMGSLRGICGPGS